jgi:type II secretory pathway pseudopilin PulG
MCVIARNGNLMKKWIKIVVISILLLLIVGALGVWKNYKYTVEIQKLELMYMDNSYFQSAIDNFYYKNLNYPNTEDYKRFSKEYFLIFDDTPPSLIESIKLNENLTVFSCTKESIDTNRIKLLDYLLGNHCVVFQYEKNFKNIYSKKTAYKEGALVKDEAVDDRLKNIFWEIKKLYAYDIVKCDTSKLVHIEIGANHYYTLIKGKKKNGKFNFSFEYSEYDKIENQNFYIDELNKRINAKDFVKNEFDLVYIPFNFIEPENYECNSIN